MEGIVTGFCSICGSPNPKWLCDAVIGWRFLLEQNPLAAQHPHIGYKFPARRVLDSRNLSDSAFTCDAELCDRCTRKEATWSHMDLADVCPVHSQTRCPGINLLSREEADDKRAKILSSLRLLRLIRDSHDDARAEGVK